MNWYYTVAGGHTHVRVFMNGKCGELCFGNEEFAWVMKQVIQRLPCLDLINETPTKTER